MSFLALCALVVCATAAPAVARTTTDAAAPRVVVLGDSLASGRGIGARYAFPAVLQARIEDAGYNYEVVNAGISGDTSAGGVRRLSTALAGQVRVLVVALGANDGLRGLPVDQLKTNLSRIIEAAQSRGIAVLLCGMEALPVHGWNYTISFHQAYEQLATRYHVPVVPFMLSNVIGDPSLMQADRVHPNVEGARVIAANIWPYLEPLLSAKASAF
jgi:acyl-CoA thioesterase-1